MHTHTVILPKHVCKRSDELDTTFLSKRFPPLRVVCVMHICILLYIILTDVANYEWALEDYIFSSKHSDRHMGTQTLRLIYSKLIQTNKGGLEFWQLVYLSSRVSNHSSICL